MMRETPVKLQHKLVIVIMLTSLIPLVLFSAFSLYTFNNNYMKLINEQYSAEIGKSASILGYYLDTFYSVVNLQYDNDQYDHVQYLQHIMQDSAAGRQEVNGEETQSFLKEIADSNSYINSCILVTPDGVVHAYSKSGYELADSRLFLKKNQYGKVLEYEDHPFLIPLHEADYYAPKGEMVCAVGRIYHFEDKSSALYIEIDPEAFEVLFSANQMYGRGYLKVIDGADQTVYERKQNIDRRAASIAANLQQLVFSREIPGKDLTILFNVDKVTVMADVYVLRGIMILVIICCVALVMITSSRFSRQLTEPIHQMIGEMDRLKTGDFSVRLPVRTNDEIGVLSECFNDMSEQLKTYINKSYVAQIKEKEAELTALKSQIYPHFLYNTLEVIRMTALDQEDEKTALMIEALSEQMRYVIGTAQDLVPLGMEMDVLRKYICLINYRYEGRVAFETETEDLSGCMIPKLILQPVVENAFFHGLKPNGGEGVIEVLAEESEEDIHITVMDNGVGMNEEEMGRLMELLESERPGNKSEYHWQSIGLKNVHDRLRYLYGPEYGIAITSREGMGTAVCITIPKNLEEL